MADTNTAGPNTPVAVFDCEALVESEAVPSLVPLSTALIKFWRDVSVDPVADEEEDVESLLDDASVV